MRHLLACLLVLLLVPAATAAERAPIGALTLVDETGTERTLAEIIDGREAIVHLWATWCGPCLAELPQLAEARASDPDLADRLVVVSVDRASFSRVRGFLDGRLGLTDLPTYQVTGGDVGTILSVSGYPTTLLFNADGTLAGRHTGVLEWRVLKGGGGDRAADTIIEG